MAIYVRNASGLQLDEVLHYDTAEALTVEEFRKQTKGYDAAPEEVKAAWDAHFEKQVAAQTDAEALEEDLALLGDLKSYISTMTEYLDKAKAARKTTVISILKNLTTADFTKEKLDPILKDSGFISYHQLLGQIASHVDGPKRKPKAEDQRARDWSPIEGIKAPLVAKVAELAKVK